MAVFATTEQALNGRRFLESHDGHQCRCGTGIFAASMINGIVVSKCSGCGQEVVSEDEWQRLKVMGVRTRCSRKG